MTEKARTIKLAGLEFSEDPPSIPEGASRWEEQELRRHWRNAMKYLADTAVQAAELRTHVHKATDPPRANVSGGGLVYNATEATAAMIEYHAVHDGVVHRLALAAKAAAAGTAPPMVCSKCPTPVPVAYVRATLGWGHTIENPEGGVIYDHDADPMPVAAGVAEGQQ